MAHTDADDDKKWILFNGMESSNREGGMQNGDGYESTLTSGTIRNLPR